MAPVGKASTNMTCKKRHFSKPYFPIGSKSGASAKSQPCSHDNHQKVKSRFQASLIIDSFTQATH